MTLGTLMPLLAVLGALVVVPLFVWRLRGLPDSMSPDYDPVQTPLQARGLKLVIGSQMATPVLFYLILNVFMPEEGTLVLF